MTPRIIWDYPARTTLRWMHWQTAAMLCRAVIDFAERGEGRIEWVAPYHRLQTGLYEMALVIDREARTVTVLRIYRARR